ncbi:glycosyltransferase [Phormidesmis priestleyi]
MYEQPGLSIVTPTRGNFSDNWLERLLTIKGNVQFVLVYPPDVKPREIKDSRVKSILSPYKGEVIQRGIGILNATGQYLIALDDDDFLHPDVLALTLDYFQHFPESWILRLSKKDIDYQDQTTIERSWAAIPKISELATSQQKKHQPELMQALPIAPLQNRFKLKSVWLFSHTRTDHHGAHAENFNNKVWKTELAQQAMVDLLDTTRIFKHIIWLPFWNLDRLLSLFIQAKHFQPGITIGHWLHESEQVRQIVRPTALKEVRTMFPSDMLLAIRFPQFGYLWNLFWDEFYIALKTVVRHKLMPK